MYEMQRLFCVDIVLTEEIFRTVVVPRYASYHEEGFVRMCLFLVHGTKGQDVACKIEGILPLLRCVLFVSSEILSLE